MSETPIGKQFLAGVALVSLATLLFEVLLTRIFSVTMWYHFAFLALSIAMFGMTAGSMAVFLLPGVFTREKTRFHAAASAILFAVAIVGSFLSHLCIPFVFEASLVGVWSMTLTYLLMAVPFAAGGICLTLILTRFPAEIGRLYAADLGGAALGCLSLHGLLQALDGPSAVIMAAFAAGLGAFFLAREAESPALARTALVFCLLTASFCAWNKGRIAEQDPLIRLRYVKGEIEAPAIFEKWNSFSRIRVYGDPDWPAPPFAWGLSPAYQGRTLLKQLILNIDATAGTIMTNFEGDLGRLEHLKFDIANFAHHLRASADTLVVGAGGGKDVLSALVFGQRSVRAVEINDDTLGLVNEVFGEFTGHLDRKPGVTFINDEARSYAARTPDRFGLIQVSLIDTWAATAAGAFALSENGLYTVEAWSIFLERLAPGGILTFARWYSRQKPFEMYRLVSLAAAALQRRGVRDLRQHIAMVMTPSEIHTGSAADGVCSILVSPDPFSAADRQRIAQVASMFRFEVALSPEVCGSPDLAALTDPGSFSSFIGAFPMDISPSTDDRPFFFNMLHLRDVLDIGRWNEGVVFFLFALLVIATILTIGAVGVPLALSGAARAEGPWGAPMVYFGGIGFGFMLVEVALMQKLLILLGHPTYSLVVVLFALLLSSGLGSLSIQGRPPTRWMASSRLGLLVGCLTGLTLIWPQISSAVQPASTFVRILGAVAIVFPLGLLMGTAFPLGMGLAARRHPGLAPWLWGVNGATSILGSVLAMVIAFGWGISWSFRVGIACYAMALAVTPWLPTGEGSSPEVARTGTAGTPFPAPLGTPSS